MWNANPAKDRDSRVIRRVFTIASALSLVLCLATAVLWVRSMHRADVAWFATWHLLFCDVNSDSGKIGVRVIVGYPWEEPPRWESFPRGVYDGRYDHLPSVGIRMGEFHRWRRFGMSGDYGITRADLNANGTVRRVGQEPIGDLSEAMHYSSVDDVPLWLACLLTAIMPLAWLRGFTRRLRRSPNVCGICGYDLSATPDRCPECGAAVPKKGEAVA